MKEDVIEKVPNSQKKESLVFSLAKLIYSFIKKIFSFLEKKEKPYNSVLATQYFLKLAYDKKINLVDNDDISKFQNLLFIAYSYLLIKYNRALLNEQPRAWIYGYHFSNSARELIEITKSNLDLNIFDLGFDNLKKDQAINEALIKV